MSTNNAMPGFSMRQSGLNGWPHAWSTWLGSSVWPIMVLIFVAFGLLWAVHQVTHSIVQQSHKRAQIVSAYNKATWHCNRMLSRSARESCLSKRLVTASEIPAQQP